jgi:hypothetical protein
MYSDATEIPHIFPSSIPVSFIHSGVRNESRANLKVRRADVKTGFLG